jgi:hypothetical protein
MVLLGNSGAISNLTLPDYQAAAEASHVRLGASVCVYAISAYAHTVAPAADDKIRTSDGTLQAAGASVTYSTGSTPIGGFTCFILAETSSDIGIWEQMGMRGTWPVTP